MSYQLRNNSLVAAETRLRGYFLNFQPRTTTYTQRQMRQAESYVIHLHSEIECYFEDMVRFILQATESQWKSNNRATKPLLFLTSFYNEKATFNKIPTSDVWEERIDIALQAHRTKLYLNHGIGPKNIVTLYGPIGFDVRTIDDVLLSELNSFGKLRGGYAHSTLDVRAGATFDPFIFSAQAQRIFSLIQNFDQTIQQFISDIQ